MTPDKTIFMTLVDEVIEEELEIINELIQEEVMPLIEYQKKLEKEAFDKAYKDLRELERES